MFIVKLIDDHDSLRKKIFVSDSVTGMTIWDWDCGQDPIEFISVECTFWERVDYWTMANLWVVPTRIIWKQTKNKLVRKGITFNNRSILIEDLKAKLGKAVMEHAKDADKCEVEK